MRKLWPVSKRITLTVCWMLMGNGKRRTTKLKILHLITIVASLSPAIPRLSQSYWMPFSIK